MGKWVYRESLNHKCARPGYSYSIKKGDIWECDCGKLWIVASVGNDQRDGGWLTWNEFHGAVPKQTGYAVNKLGGESTPGVTSWRDR